MNAAFAVDSAPLLAVAGAVGLALLVLGWRGRRVDEHPLCRRCGFDLTGKPVDSAACAECGADVTRRRAVRIGHRAPRRAWVVGGLLLMVPGLVRTGRAGWDRAAAIDYAPYKPAAWLVAEAGDPNVATRPAAVAELKRRLAAGRLTRDHLVPLAAHATAAVGTRQWMPEFAGLVNDGYAAGLLPHDAWEAYWRSAIRVTLNVRPNVSVGDPLPFQVAVAVDASAAHGAMTGSTAVRRWGVYDGVVHGAWQAITGGEAHVFRIIDNRVLGPLPLPSIPFAPSTIPQLHAAAPGPQVLWCRVDVRLRWGNATGVVRTEAVAPFTLMPRGVSSVGLVDDPALRQQIADALRPSQLNTHPDGRFSCGIAVMSAALPRSTYVAHLCRGRQVLAIAPFTFGGGASSVVNVSGRTPGNAGDGALQLILVPDPSAAVATTDVTSLPLGAIVLDVPRVVPRRDRAVP